MQVSIIESTSDLKNKIRIINNIGTAYSDLKDYSNALYNFNKSLYYSQTSNDIELICIALINIGIVKLNLGLYQESLSYFQKAIDFSSNINPGFDSERHILGVFPG